MGAVGNEEVGKSCMLTVGRQKGRNDCRVVVGSQLAGVLLVVCLYLSMPRGPAIRVREKAW